MRLWANASGTIVEFDVSWEYNPKGYPRTVEIDNSTNRDLVTDILADVARYAIDGQNRLRKDGVIVTIAPEGAEFGERRELRAIFQRLKQGVHPTEAEEILLWKHTLKAVFKES
jgi:hypothetical protein